MSKKAKTCDYSRNPNKTNKFPYSEKRSQALVLFPAFRKISVRLVYCFYSETKKGMIKSEDDVETEIYSALGKEEEKIIAYVLNEDGEFVLSAVAKDDAKETYLTISLEKSHD